MRFLRSANSSSSPPRSPPSSPPAEGDPVDSDFVVILAALLCALICVLGLVAVARCTWIRRFSGISSSTPANKGLNKKALNSLPKSSFSPDHHSADLSDGCPICLSEFLAGEEIRVLPHCFHAFHVSCIDTWLRSHSSCPSCRQILAAPRCHKCGGGLPDSSAVPPPISVRDSFLP